MYQIVTIDSKWYIVDIDGALIGPFQNETDAVSERDMMLGETGN
jgi:hypothetical protein